MDLYGRAVVRERLTPPRYADVDHQLRREFGPGTGLGYFLAEVAAAPPRRRSGPRGLRRALRALVEAVRAAVNGNGRKPEAESARTSRVGE